jgi:hypothetical protein
MADVPLMENPMTTAGDTIYGGAAGDPTRLAKGTAGQVLTMNAGATAPEWAAGGAGGGGGGIGEFATKYNPDHETPATATSFAEEFNGSRAGGWAWDSAPATDDLTTYPGFLRVKGTAAERHLAHAWVPGASDVTVAAKVRRSWVGADASSANVALYVGDTTGNPANLVMLVMDLAGIFQLYTENGAGSFTLIGNGPGGMGAIGTSGEFYLRLTRLNSGPTWTASASADGITWSVISTTTNKALTIGAIGIRVNSTSDYAVDWIRGWTSIVEKVGA